MFVFFYFILTFLNLAFGNVNELQELELDDVRQINCPPTILPRPSFCRKPCSHQEQCRRGNKVCICDGECGLSCISKSINCHPLVDLPHGYIRTQNGFNFNSIAEYGLKCPPPPEVPYAVYKLHPTIAVNEENELDSEAHYSCISGYRDSGQTTSTIRCSLDNKGIANWDEPRIKCKAQECQDPGIPLNGFRSGDLLHFPHTLDFSCAPGFNIVGSIQRMCTSIGEWSEIKCPPLPIIWNGYVEGDDTVFGSIVVFRCFEGMSHIGAPFAKCEENGKWSSSVPKCLANCKVPRIRNGRLDQFSEGELIPHGTKWRPDIKPKCVFQRHPSIEGQILWSRVKRSNFNLATKDERVIFKKCELPTEKKTRKSGWKLTIKESGQELTVVCKAGFEFDVGSSTFQEQFSHCVDGHWTPKLIECKPSNIFTYHALNDLFVRRLFTSLTSTLNIFAPVYKYKWRKWYF
uniref:Sushi domain-containing protein n=1 Tax=Meloidogyne hapla TaxID=6305 RepID=A0A1I8BHZ1_MELHA